MDKNTNQAKSKFIHLHVHSHYSLLDGLGKIDDILDRAKELKMDSIALTDHGVMYGAVEFYKKAKEKGIKPIIGCETYLAANGMENKRSKIDDLRYHLVLLAKNETGYKNLIKLISLAHIKGYYYKPRIDKELLKKHAKGLIATSACMAGEIPQIAKTKNLKKAEKAILEYQKIFGKDNFYLELEYHENSEEQKQINQALIELSKKTGAKLVATCDIHYVNKTDKEVQDVLLCIQQNKKVDDTKRLTMKEFDLYMKSEQEMLEHFKDVPQAVTNTREVAQKCNFELEMGVTKLPYFKIPGNQDENEYLRKLCEAGVEKRYGKNPAKEVQERLDFELGVIQKMGYSSYFLIVADFVNWAKEKKIVVGPGRGSAAGSIVSYLLNITNIDPIKYELLFERFLNPDRISMPDIDIDFADNRRDEVIDYVSDKYGKDNVAQIITFGTMAARAAIKDAGRALNYPYDLCDKISKEIPAFTKLEDALEKSQELKRMYDSDQTVKKNIDMAKRLEGVARHASTHACGVVITKEPLVEYLPLQQNLQNGKKENTLVTQFEGKAVENLGLLKMDFLGLKNLTILQNVIDIIRGKHKKEIDLDSITLDDQKTLKLFEKGETTGVFQFESSGFKRYLKELKPSRFQDLIDMVALYRPGPMEWIPDYILGKHGKRKITYLHPKLKPILEKTYGIIVVQEQVMEIAKKLAGFTAGEADYLRKAMGKKIKKLMDEQRDKFILGCIKNEIKGKTAEKIWDFIKPFAGYGFNWAHSACYAMIGYQTAYFKAHYPVEFMAALLSSDENNTDRISIEIAECRKMGIEVLPPDVNESFGRFASVDQEERTVIRYGLNAIKNVGEKLAEIIIQERKSNGKFKNFVDFIKRIESKDLNKKSLESLAKSGALESLVTKEEILANIDKILKFAKETRDIKKSGQSSLFQGGALEETFNDNVLDLSVPEDFSIDKKERLIFEKDMLGVYITENPLKDYEDYLLKNMDKIQELEEILKNNQNKTSFRGLQNPSEQVYTIGGIITTVKKIYTKNNQEMAFVQLEDLSSKIELVVFPKVFIKFHELLKEDNIVFAKGKINDKDGNLKLLCDKIGLITEEIMQKTKNNKLKAQLNIDSKLKKIETKNEINTTKFEEELNNDFVIEYQKENLNKDKLKEFLNSLEKGKGQIILKIPDNDGVVKKIKLKQTFKLAGENFNKFKEYLKNCYAQQ
jgi:DNA polymerase-3 subunit alpha